MRKQYISIRIGLLLLLCIFAHAAAAQRGLDIKYNVAVGDPAARQFKITTDIANINQPKLELALPTWTPGWYVVENYAKNVIRLRITDSNGKVLQPRMTKKQTWSVDTSGVKKIRVEYDYSATILALNQAKVGDDFAFFTGIELFLEPVGHRDTPSTLRFDIPARWKLLSPLKETSDANVFTAANYDTLVDAPALMGHFDVTEFQAEGKPHYFAAYPAGTFNADKSKRFTEMLAKVVTANKKLFGDVPYDKYIAYYFFTPPESNAGGALEHLNSYVAFAPSGERASPEMIIGTGSHEYFHLWNVKRIRPAEMWPYDYSRENESPSLWLSEGFTNYYGARATYRGGVNDKDAFLRGVANAAAGVENSAARAYISPANSSMVTWVGYDTPQAFQISYYTQGQNLGALLDLSIRHDTDGRSSFDDVFRTLYSDFYKRGKGFTTNDLITIINKLTGKNYTEFFDKYIFGTEVPDYERIFGYAGYQLVRKPMTTPDLGFSARMRDGGIAITGVETAAAKAGLKVGDLLVKVDGKPAAEMNQSALGGKNVTFTVRRQGREIDIPIMVGTRSFTNFSLADAPNITAAQQKVRDSWLAR